MNNDYFDKIDRQLGLEKLNAKLCGVCSSVAHYLDAQVPSSEVLLSLLYS